MSQLVPCPACSRHHHLCEPLCPFCGATLPGCKAGQANVGPGGRMSRATLIAASAVLLGAAACDNVQPLYGVPPPPPARDASSDAAAAADAKATGNANFSDDGKSVQDPTNGRDGGTGQGPQE